MKKLANHLIKWEEIVIDYVPSIEVVHKTRCCNDCNMLSTETLLAEELVKDWSQPTIQLNEEPSSML